MTEQEFKVFAEKVKSGKLLKIQYAGAADSIRILNVYKENRKDLDEKLRYAADIEVHTKNYQMMYRNFLSVVRNSMSRKEVTDTTTNTKKEVYTIRLVDLLNCVSCFKITNPSMLKPYLTGDFMNKVSSATVNKPSINKDKSSAVGNKVRFGVKLPSGKVIFYLVTMNRTPENIKTLSNIFGDLCVGFSQFYTIDKYPDKACDIALSNDETTNKCKGISRILSMLNGKRNDAFLQVIFGHGTTDSTVKKGIDIVMDELKSEGSIEDYKALKDVKDKSSVDFKVTVEEVTELMA